MTNPTKNLGEFDLDSSVLGKEWRITIQCPVGGVEQLANSLGSKLELKQGSYDHCLFIRDGGRQTFRALAGSHAGDEGSVQTTNSSEIILTIPADIVLLRMAFELIFEYGVQEEPTIHVEEIWSSRSKYLDDKDNPNRYWNRPDAKEIHGQASVHSSDHDA
jgi:hypothetical protein